MRPQALAALADVELIVHAGDIGGAHILTALNSVAPTVAVRGNNDNDHWAQSLPLTARAPIGPYALYVIHERKRLDPAQLHDNDIVIFGHSHKPEAKRDGDRWFINPGSAGPRRFRLPISLARLHLTQTVVTEFVTLS